MRDFLSSGTRTAKLASRRIDGRPHVTPVWFVLDGDDVMFTTGDNNIKGKTIQRDGRAALCVDDNAPPYSFVTVAGNATWSDDLDEMLVWATRIGARYMGADRAEEFGQRNGVPGELVVRIRPLKILAHFNMTG